MGKIGSTAKIAELERLFDESGRFVDMAIRFRVLTEDASPGRLIMRREVAELRGHPNASQFTGPALIGGRWDTMLARWVEVEREELAFRAVEWTIQEQQIPVLFSLHDDVTHVGVFAGRQAGKTYVGIQCLVADAVRWPGRKSAVISLDFKASRDPEGALRSLPGMREWGVLSRQSRKKSSGAGHNRTDRIYRLPNGHEVVFRSRENIDSVRGPSLKTILMDEASRYKREDLTTAEGCGAASKSFRIYLPTTPRRESAWIREADRDWGSPERKARAIFRLRTLDNPRCNRKLIEELRENTPADLFEQEFNGQVVAPENAVWYLFDHARHNRRPGELPPDLREGLRGKPVDVTRQFCLEKFGVAADYLGGWDFGKEAAIRAQVFRDARDLWKDGKSRIEYRDRLYVVDEAVNYRTTTEHHAAHVASKWGTSIVFITDHMGDHERSEGRGVAPAATKILREAGFARVVAVGPKNPEIDNTVRAVGRLLLNSNGDTRLFVDAKACPKLVEALENQERGTDGHVIKDGKREHVIDCLRYLVWMAFPVRREGAGNQRQAYASRSGG